VEELSDLQGIHIFGYVGQFHIVVDQYTALAEAINAHLFVPLVQLRGSRIDVIELGKKRILKLYYYYKDENEETQNPLCPMGCSILNPF